MAFARTNRPSGVILAQRESSAPHGVRAQREA
jgi:hypothetical protein